MFGSLTLWKIKKTLIFHEINYNEWLIWKPPNIQGYGEKNQAKCDPFRLILFAVASAQTKLFTRCLLRYHLDGLSVFERYPSRLLWRYDFVVLVFLVFSFNRATCPQPKWLWMRFSHRVAYTSSTTKFVKLYKTKAKFMRDAAKCVNF